MFTVDESFLLAALVGYEQQKEEDRECNFRSKTPYRLILGPKIEDVVRKPYSSNIGKHS